MVLGTEFLNRFIRRIFCFTEKNCTVACRNGFHHQIAVIKKEVPFSHTESSKLSSLPHKAVVRTAKHVIVQHYSRMRALATTSAVRLYFSEPVPLNIQFFQVHVAPEIIGPFKGRTKKILIESIVSTMQHKTNEIVLKVCRTIACTHCRLSLQRSQSEPGGNQKSCVPESARCRCLLMQQKTGRHR